jgi:hypothetical protein
LVVALAVVAAVMWVRLVWLAVIVLTGAHNPTRV